MAFIEVEGVSFTYAGAAKPALRDLSFTVEEGEFCLILSPNGGGKTTLLSLLGAGDAPRGTLTGTLRVKGERAVFLRQDPDLALVADKVWREIAFAPENRGLDRDEIRLRVAEAAGFFSLEGLFYRDVATLSGSEKVKTVLAAQMADRPDLFLLDEPAGGLDPMGERDLAEALIRIRAETGGTVLAAEQYCDPFFARADRILYLEQGELLFNGTPIDAARFLLETGREGYVPEAARLGACFCDPGDLPLTVGEARARLADKRFSVSPIAREETAKEALLSLNDVSFRYEKDAPDLIACLDLSLRKGEILCLLGKGGAGKSTLLRLLAGDLAPLKGKRHLQKGIKIAYLPQDVRCVFEKETVREELESVDRNGTTDALVRFGLTDLAARHPLDLSGGERQAAALAKIALTRPDLLLLDEPTRGLDPDARRRLAAHLSAWKKAGTSILLATHDISFAARVGDRCGLLWGGELAALTDTDAFFKELRLFTTATARITRGSAVLPEEVEP